MSIRFLFFISLFCFTYAAYCDDPAAVVPTVSTVDATAKWIGYGWAAITALGALLTGLAAAVRAFFPASSAATAIDTIAHVTSAIGTTIRPSQIMPPKQ